jgi:molybdopterin molybdotransferase
MISVDAALNELFALVSVLGAEPVSLRAAAGRVLAADVTAARDQPPFAASAMDGYAVSGTHLQAGQTFTVIGEAAAGHRWHGTVQRGEAVRIFTGAPLPPGTDHVVIQENVSRDGDLITVNDSTNNQPYVRAAGADFKQGDQITAPRLITSSDVALFAAMNIAQVQVTRKPVIAIIATGDELVQPGEAPRDDQIIASNSYGLAALLEGLGAQTRLLPIARDDAASLALAFTLAQGADLIVTIGGASVGDHDLVSAAAQKNGLDRAFYKVAMRPGKPLMAGKMGAAAMIGLPGNPVSAMVCGHIFLAPVIAKMRGLGERPAPRETAYLAAPITPNGPREHYMRATLDQNGVTVFERQDSALLGILAQATCLAVRPPYDTARKTGDPIEIIRL